MPLASCTIGGKPGVKWGDSGTCYPHDGSPAGIAAARQKAMAQAVAMGEFPGTGGRQNELETVDLEAVEILSVGGPVRAIGSPPSGDYWTAAQLRAMVDAATELGDELKAPARIGHRKTGETQDGALRVSPAVGWLENQRLNADGTKLLADIKRVPAKFAETLKAGAWRTRSSELSKITSQRTGKTYDYVVSGLAWLGDRLPAVQTLDDVVALYEGDNGQRVLVVVDEHDSIDPDRAFMVIERLLELVTREIDEPADSQATMPDSKYTDEQRLAFQEATALADDQVTDEVMAAAGVKPETAGDDGGEGEDGGEEGERSNEDIERRLEAAEKEAAEAKKAAATANETLRLNQRAQFVETVIREGKETPGRQPAVETLYDRLGHDEAVRWYQDAHVDETLLREHGSDRDATDEPTEEQKRHLEAELAAIFPGYEAEEVKA